MKNLKWMMCLALSLNAGLTLAETTAQSSTETKGAEPATQTKPSLQVLQSPAKNARKVFNLTNAKGETVNVTLDVSTYEGEGPLNRDVTIEVDLRCKRGSKEETFKRAFRAETCVFSRFAYDSLTNSLLVDYIDPRMQIPGEARPGTLKCDKEETKAILLECPTEPKKRVERRK